MTTTLLYYTNIVTSSEVIKHGAIAITDGQIRYVGPMENAPHSDGLKIDLRGKYVAPGFIDIHVHGGKGVAFGESNDPRGELDAYSKWVASAGVTGYLCSLAAPDALSLAEQISKFADVLDKGVEGAQPIGLHLEGPFINIKKPSRYDPLV